MSEHGMSCHDRGIMSMYDMSWNLHERRAMPVSSYMSKGTWGAFGRAGLGGGAQHQKSCGINFNKFLHLIKKQHPDNFSKGYLMIGSVTQ